jgi:hypothetical protein
MGIESLFQKYHGIHYYILKSSSLRSVIKMSLENFVHRFVNMRDHYYKWLDMYVSGFYHGLTVAEDYLSRQTKMELHMERYPRSTFVESNAENFLSIATGPQQRQQWQDAIDKLLKEYRAQERSKI